MSNGARALIDTLTNAGVDTCFTNPGTSEMHMVSAIGASQGMRSILCLFEGGCSGAADGYARMAGKPACTLFHLGPGLSNASANIHNARKAHAPMINLVGDHATYHKKFDAPLNSDVIGLSGNSGRSTAPHLHFEIRLEGRSQDPLDFVAEGVQ